MIHSMALSEFDSSEPSPTQQLAKDYPSVDIQEVSVDRHNGTVTITCLGDLSYEDERLICDALSSEDEPLPRIKFVNST